MVGIGHTLRRRVRQALERGSVRRVVLGLSGGADSTALLRLLHDCGTEIMAVHCNFHLRGEESMRDMRFCAGLCESLGIQLTIRHFDVPEFMERTHTCVEEACRILRYRLFDEILSDTGADRIAVAHNADDNIETLLLNLFRGTGITGLRGMLPDNGRIIRPLLSTTRKEIIQYLDACGAGYVTDSTNLDSNYRRNFIRNRLMPMIEEKWPGARKTIQTSIDNLRTDSMTLDTLASDYMERNRLLASLVLPLRILDEWEDPEWLIHRWSSQFGVRSNVPREIARSLICRTYRPGASWKADGGRILATKDGLLYEPADNDDPRDEDPSALFETKEFAMDHALYERIIQNSDNRILWLPEPPEHYLIRRYRQGDRIAPLGMKGTTLVSKILKDAGVKATDRWKTIIVEHIATGELIWVAALKRSRHHLVLPANPRAYRLRPIGKFE